MLEYESDLKSTLADLKIVMDELDKLKMQKDEIRDAVRKFLKMHELDEFETKDTDGQLWRLGITNSERRSVNYDALGEMLTEEQLDEVIVISPSERLNTKPVKSYKKKNGKKAPRAPRANVMKNIENKLGDV
jgi:hypothetical protein